MANLNKIQIIGNVTNTPQVKTFANGKLVEFCVAVNENYTDRNGNKVESSDFFNCKAGGKLAEIIENYVTKGSSVYVEGRMKHRDYVDKDGKTRTLWDVMTNSLQMLSKKDGSTAAQTSKASPVEDDDPEKDLPF